MKIGLTILALLAALPAAAQDAKSDRTARFNAAFEQLRARAHAPAIAALDGLIAEYDKEFANEKRLIFCAENQAETLAYMTMGASQKKSAVAVDSVWCKALWAKGYALVDQGRIADGIPFLERAVAMAPMHSHYLLELGYAYQALKRFQRSYDIYKRAADAAALEDEQYRKLQLGRAWRGMGFALIELGKLDEAEALFRKCLELDPNDEKAKNELQYIAEQRGRKS